MKTLAQNRKVQWLNFFQYVFFISIILYLGRSLFIPLTTGLLISFILYPFCRWLENHKIPRIISILIGLSVFFLISLSFIGLLIYQFSKFMEEWPQINEKLVLLINELETNISSSKLQKFIDPELGLIGSITDYISVHLIPEIPSTLYNSSISLVLFIIIPIFSALILMYREVLVAFLYEIFPVAAKKYIEKILPDVIVTYYNFIKGMIVVYLIVGVLNSLGLFLIGIPNPIFFGFIASILTFIPYVGITVGALLPMAISWIKFNSIFYPIGVIVVFTIVQILEANVIFPLEVSQKLKINALVTLIVIVAGGIIWGAMGMILFLPLIAILKLIADQVKELRAISILLGTKKDLDQDAFEKGKSLNQK
ncbi:AI-2E family transporter [Marivirga arenosa]|uniref:AI-2E family transporter n=1 Tax=Marivirga arenosa TaxID=3059076 RepID=A0AA51ZSB2_9BACT|nr:AI-2E family transporter [Marivirga sp. BKB1-2]WNB16930.1 AI-2E family transporter [Marivirga sp. BKB1-2]